MYALWASNAAQMLSLSLKTGLDSRREQTEPQGWMACEAAQVSATWH